MLGAKAEGIGKLVVGGIFAVVREAVALADGVPALAFAGASTVAFRTAYSYVHFTQRMRQPVGSQSARKKARNQDKAMDYRKEGHRLVALFYIFVGAR